jgi:hypothetical protein
MIGVPIPLVPAVQIARVNGLPKRLTAPSRSFLNGLLGVTTPVQHSNTTFER